MAECGGYPFIGKGDSLVSFSALDEVSNTRALHKKSEAEKSDKSKKQQSQALSAAGSGGGGITMTALERAIESLAALVGKSYVKEEIVHGSYRYCSAVPSSDWGSIAPYNSFTIKLYPDDGTVVLATGLPPAWPSW